MGCDIIHNTCTSKYMFNWFEHGGTVPPTRRLQRQNKNDMEKNDLHSSEWHMWDSSYFLLLGEWYSFHVIRREKEYGISN